MKRGRKDRKVVAIERNNEFSRLPEELLLNILGRLPTKFLMRCRCVCRSWRSITRDAHFVNTIHLNGWVKNSTPTFLIWHSSGDCPSLKEIVFGTVGHKVRVASMPSNCLSSLGSFDRSLAMVSSVNGLVCFSSRFQDGSYGRWVFVCNPITRETMAVPNSASDAREFGPSGFVFSTSTHRYKLFRIFTPHQRTLPHEQQRCEVLDLGTKNWRDLGPLPIRVAYKKIAALVDGSLHWLASNNLDILSIDIESENMKILQTPGPQSEAWIDDHLLVGIGGYLSVVHYHNQVLEIWILKDNTWSREYRIRGYDPVAMIPIAIRGTMVILKVNDKLASYDSKKRVLSLFPRVRNLDDILPFTGSLVSLASLGNCWQLRL